MNLHLDGISALERIKLSAMLPAEIEALTGSSPMQRVQIAGRIAAILEQLGQDTPEAIPAIELSGNEFGEFPDTPEGATERRTAAWNHYLEQLIPSGGVFCLALQAKVQFNKTGAKKVISLSGDPRKVKLIAGLPEIIATGRKTSEAEPTAKAARSGVVKVFVLKANVNLEGQAIRARILVRQMADGTYGYDHSVDRGEAAQVTGGSSGALDSVVSTENGRSVLLPDEASPGRDLHHLKQMIGEEGAACNVLDSVSGEVLNLFLDDEVVTEVPAGEEFPLAEASSSYSGISHRGGAYAKADRDTYESAVRHEIDDARRFAETETQQAVLVSEEAAFRSDYLSQYRRLMQVRSSTYSAHIAGRSGLNSKQANARNSALDKANDRFYTWFEAQKGRIKAAVLRARSPEQLAAEKAAQDAKQEEKARQSVDFMVKLMSFKRGDDLRLGDSVITKINKDKGGYPSTLTFTFADGTKPFDDKIDLLRVLYRGDKEALRRDADAAIALLNPAPTPKPGADAVVQALTAKGNPIIDEAVLADLGLIREVYDRWKYRYAVGAPELFASTKEGAIEQGSDAYAKADPSELLTKEQRFAKSNADFYADFDARYGKMSIEQVRKIIEEAKPNRTQYINNLKREFKPDVGRSSSAAMATQGAREGAELARQLERYLAEREAKEGASTVEPAPTVVEPAPAYEIIEHVTKGGKGKTIRGIVRTDLSYAEAKAIDEYTFRKDGGYFIREKHLAGASGVGIKLKDLAARRDPEDPDAEMRRLEAAAQAYADRLADEQLRQQQKITQQVTKLRDVAASTLERAEAEIGRDRLANTRRRASMAASGIANAEASRAIALTMNNLADAIERGQAQHLAGITSRADVQTLSDSLRGGRYAYEKANNISHMETERRKHNPYTRDEAFYATFPVAKWDSAGASRARILEMIKGKRGAPAIANEIRYSSEMTREQILALRNILGQKELESQLGWWNVEQLARGERLRRAGITNTMQLREALGEFIEFKAGARQEDPIAKAERAIIGQKVGIDFFPTPKGESKTMATLARIKEGDDVLEPSAGNGNLADAAKAAGANVDVIEISSQLRDILTAKGYNVVAHDFSSYTPTKQYDAILMNPPFSNRQDADHIMRAFTMLKPGGRLVAIAGEGVFFGRDAKATAFREWLDEHGAEVEGLAGGTFKDTSLLATTGANARRIVLMR